MEVSFHTHSAYMDTMFINMYGSHQLEKNLLLNKTNNLMDNHAIQVLKSNDMVDYLSCEFS